MKKQLVIKSASMATHQFKHLFSCLIAGPSQCAKTTFVESLIKHQTVMIFPVPKSVVWHYSEFQPAYLCLLNKMVFSAGTPSEEQLKTYSGKLVVNDDLTSAMGDASSNLFTKKRPQLNMNVIYIVQNLFNCAKKT